MRTDKECKSLISSVAWSLGVSPRLISTRLLDDNDKNDLRHGLVSESELECAVEVWRGNGMPDYANGKTLALKYER